MRWLSRSVYPALVIALTLAANGLAAPPSKPALTPQDYGKWEDLTGNPVISSDGKWMAYTVRRVNRERDLRLRSLEGDWERAIAWGENPQFSDDNAWVVWSIGVSEKERQKLEKEKKTIRLDAALLRLGEEEEKRFQAVSRLSFDATGKFVALLAYPPEKPEGQGGLLRVLDLRTQAEFTFGRVSEFAWSEQGSLLAMTVTTGEDAGNGVQVFDAAAGRLRSLHFSGSVYRGLRWREEGPDLAFLRSLKPASAKGSAYTVLASQGLDGDQPVHRELDPGASGVAEGLEVSPHRTPEWSKDGRSVSLGLRPSKPKPEDPQKDSPDTQAEGGSDNDQDQKKQDEPELPSLQVWHSSDVRIFPQQKAAEKRDAQRTRLVVWHLEGGNIVQIGSDLMQEAGLLEGWKYGWERNDSPYPWGIMFGRPYHDVWTVNAQSGAREKVLEKVRYSWASPGGRYLLYFDGEHYWTHELETGRRVNVTSGLDTGFANREYDTPTDLLPPYRWSPAGWLEGDEAVLLYDRYDVWQVAADGSGGRRLTDGAGQQVEYWLVDLDPEEDFFSAQAPMTFRTRGEWSEKQGFARLEPGAEQPQTLLSIEQRVQGPLKAEKADVFVFRTESRDHSPNYWLSGPDLSQARQVTRTNAFQEEYAWTHAEFFEFESEAGRRLQAGLLYPVNHDPARRYPMIVYTYEILTPRVHDFEPPDERDYYNFTTWTQQGYFVLLPDIVYRAREPGISALEAVRPAVAKVVEMGLVDEARVGLIGHSWGGYQATYLPTRTNIFAASVAGAPLTDFVSFMGQIHWRPGNPEVDHWETGQARMEVPYWEDPEAHHRNSPIHKVHEMQTPLLMVFGSNDGVVDWDQGTEFYNFARRAGKQMVLLVYEGEGHSIRKAANQIDYHRRILEWFGHYLKGDPAPDWITKGIPLDALEQEKKRIKDRF